MYRSISKNNKILIAGNGGSAADAQHLSGELVGCFNFDRPPLSALALRADTSILTTIGNDYGFKEIFARQILANGQSGNIFLQFRLVVIPRTAYKPFKFARLLI